jgi:arylsulfatase A-like enzyme
MWEGGLRVPFLARWPGKLPAGKVTDAFLTALELVPTLLAASGAKAPEGVKLDGFDMLPVLRGEVESPRWEMFWQRRGDKAAQDGATTLKTLWELADARPVAPGSVGPLNREELYERGLSGH